MVEVPGLTSHRVAGLELPALEVAAIRLLENPVDMVSLLLGLYWTPHIDSFISQAHVDDHGPARDWSCS